MKRKYGVAVHMEQPKIGYRETITREAKGQGRHPTGHAKDRQRCEAGN